MTRRGKLLLLATATVFVVGVVALGGLAWFGVPSRATYKYIDLSSQGVSVGERYKPALSLYLGEKIPRVYEGSIGPEAVVIEDVASHYAFTPALRISVGPSQVITVEDLEPSCAHEVRESERDIVIWWGTCAAIDDSVGFVLRLEGADATLPLRGVVRHGGTFTDWEAL
jgi:hypothetical protein